MNLPTTACGRDGEMQCGSPRFLPSERAGRASGLPGDRQIARTQADRLCVSCVSEALAP